MKYLGAFGIVTCMLTGCATLNIEVGRQIAQGAKTEQAYPFLLFTPHSYGLEAKKRWPLIIFLHGSGERGTDIEKVKIHGPPKIVATQSEFPFVVASPLLESGGDWNEVKLEQVLQRVTHRLKIDRNRIYLTGLSRGGHATWRWAAGRSATFAAIVPIAGRGDPSQACALKKMPVWAFHGNKDGVVPPEGSSKMVDAINACGGSARLTMYSNVGHDSWTRAFDDPALYAWLLSQHKRTTEHRDINTHRD